MMRLKKVGCVLLAGLPAISGVQAEEKSAQEPEVPLVELEPVLVKGIRGGSVLPGEEDISEISGLGDRWSGWSRAFSLIPDKMMSDFDVAGINDVASMAAGTHAPHRFGNRTHPNIRGDVAEIYQNGQRRGTVLFGLQPTWVEAGALAVVRGPAPAAFGPGQYSGGYVNIDTLSPFPESSRTSVRRPIPLATAAPS